MTAVRFSGSQQVAGPATAGNGLYKFARSGATWHSRLQEAVDSYASRKGGSGLFGKVQARLVKLGGGFLSKLADSFDFREFIEIPIRGKILKIPSPPIGALTFILLPCTVGSRLYYAWQRGREHNDYREIGDILRRDIPAITAFLFLLGPLTAWMNKQKRGKDGLDLIDPTTGKLLQYSQLKNYRLDTVEAVEAVIREGNGKGFGRAIDRLEDYAKHSALKDDIARILKTGKELAATNKNDLGKIRQLAEELQPALQKAEKIRTSEVEHLLKAGAKIPSHLRDSILDIVSRYGKTRRLPVDMLCFAITLGVIGWLPLWFNEMWTRKKYQEQMKAQGASQANYDPALLFQSLNRSSQLAQAFRQRYTG